MEQKQGDSNLAKMDERKTEESERWITRTDNQIYV